MRSPRPSFITPEYKPVLIQVLKKSTRVHMRFMKCAYVANSGFNIVAITGEILNYIWVINDNDLTLVRRRDSLKTSAALYLGNYL